MTMWKYRLEYLNYFRCLLLHYQSLYLGGKSYCISPQQISQFQLVLQLKYLLVVLLVLRMHQSLLGMLSVLPMQIVFHDLRMMILLMQGIQKGHMIFEVPNWQIFHELQYTYSAFQHQMPLKKFINNEILIYSSGYDHHIYVYCSDACPSVSHSYSVIHGRVCGCQPLHDCMAEMTHSHFHVKLGPTDHFGDHSSNKVCKEEKQVSFVFIKWLKIVPTSWNRSLWLDTLPYSFASGISYRLFETRRNMSTTNNV